MFLIIGLGNPGEQYEKTRHNAGRNAVMAFQKKLGFSDFSFEKKFNALISKNKEFALILPETYMNKSGNAVTPIMRFFKINPTNLIVIHDDSDLPLGSIRICKNRGSGGHKGIESIMRMIKTKDFIRIRIGTGAKRHNDAIDMVLKKFSKDEEKIFKKVISKILLALETITKESLEKAMNKFNQ